VRVDHKRELHSGSIVSLRAASELKALPHHGRSKGVIERPGLTGRNTVVHKERCVVHLIRNALRPVARRDAGEVAKAMRAIYTAPIKALVRAALYKRPTRRSSWLAVPG